MTTYEITNVTVELGETVNAGDYENRRYKVQFVAAVPAGSDPDTVTAELLSRAHGFIEGRKAYDVRLAALRRKVSHDRYDGGMQQSHKEWLHFISQLEHDPVLDDNDKQELVGAAKLRAHEQRTKEDSYITAIAGVVELAKKWHAEDDGSTNSQGVLRVVARFKEELKESRAFDRLTWKQRERINNMPLDAIAEADPAEIFYADNDTDD